MKTGSSRGRAADILQRMKSSVHNKESGKTAAGELESGAALRRRNTELENELQSTKAELQKWRQLVLTGFSCLKLTFEPFVQFCFLELNA